MKSLYQLLPAALLLCRQHPKAVAPQRGPSLERAPPLFGQEEHLLLRKPSRPFLYRLRFSTQFFWTRSISMIQPGGRSGSRQSGVFLTAVAGHQRISKALEGTALLRHLLILPLLLQQSPIFSLWLLNATHRGLVGTSTWMVWRLIVRQHSLTRREMAI